jgi:hypothetical protein
MLDRLIFKNAELVDACEKRRVSRTVPRRDHAHAFVVETGELKR